MRRARPWNRRMRVRAVWWGAIALWGIRGTSMRGVVEGHRTAMLGVVLRGVLGQRLSLQG